MKHIDEGVLQALLDGEVPPDRRPGVEAHVAQCRACAAELEELRGSRGRLAGVLALADVPPPMLAARAAIARERKARGPLAEVRRALPRAAVLVMGMAGVAAATALPGSPVRGLVEDFLAGRADAPAVEAPAPEAAQPAALPPAAAAAPAPPPAGVSILPQGGSVRVVLSGAEDGLSVRARLSTGRHADVTLTGEAARARFRTAPGRVEVVGAGAGEVLVELPMGARAAYVEVNGRVYVAKQGDVLRPMAPTAGGTATEPLFRVGG